MAEFIVSDRASFPIRQILDPILSRTFMRPVYCTGLLFTYATRRNRSFPSLLNERETELVEKNFCVGERSNTERVHREILLSLDMIDNSKYQF